MRTATGLGVLWAAIGVLLVGGVGSSAAQNAVLMRENPTECEVANALGIAKAGCPPLAQMPAPVRRPATRGLALGTTDMMPEPPPIPAPTAAPPARPTATATTEPTSRPAPPRHHYAAAFQITFEFGSAQLGSTAHEVLDLIGGTMTAPDAGVTQFRIVGHTDAIGTPERNQKLSEDRANTVKAYLIEHFGIPPGRLEAEGRGARELLNQANPTASENRRVEITNLGR